MAVPQPFLEPSNIEHRRARNQSMLSEVS